MISSILESFYAIWGDKELRALIFVLIPPSLGLTGVLLAQVWSTWMNTRSLRQSRNVSTLTKTVDVSMHCTLRYDRLGKDYSTIMTRARKFSSIKTAAEKKDEKIEILALLKDYHSSFWVLKSDQFDFWLFGVLDHDTFFDWSYYLGVKIFRQHSGNDDESVPKEFRKSLLESWEEWSGEGGGLNHGGSNPQFVKFIRNIFSGVMSIPQDDKDRSDILVRLILKLMSDLEGTVFKRGFARKYRKHSWNGMKYRTFQKVMIKDIEDRRRESIRTQ